MLEGSRRQRWEPFGGALEGLIEMDPPNMFICDMLAFDCKKVAEKGGIPYHVTAPALANVVDPKIAPKGPS